MWLDAITNVRPGDGLAVLTQMLVPTLRRHLLGQTRGPYAQSCWYQFFGDHLETHQT
jgi:hypothetical protein